jgi:hypothetical protein
MSLTRADLGPSSAHGYSSVINSAQATANNLTLAVIEYFFNTAGLIVREDAEVLTRP